MIDYKDFVIPELYWDYFVKEKKSLFINSYLRDNNILPSEDMIKNFIIDNKEREDFRRMLYSKYCVSDIIPESPMLPDVPEEIKNVNITFGINIEDLTPINNEVNDIAIIFKNGIKNLDLLEKDEKDVKININNDRYALTIESLSDFNKIYNIPIGRYEVTGYIGKLGGTFNDNPIINFNETIDITFSGNIELHGKCNDILIISDNEFSVEISGLGKSDSHKYGEYYYYFENRIPGRNYIVTTKQQQFSFSIDHYDKIQYYYIKK